MSSSILKYFSKVASLRFLVKYSPIDPNKKFWKKVDGDWTIESTNMLTKSISTLYDIGKDGESIPYKDADYTKINDLINLSILNEPYILEAIHKRYNNDDICSVLLFVHS